MDSPTPSRPKSGKKRQRSRKSTPNAPTSKSPDHSDEESTTTEPIASPASTPRDDVFADMAPSNDGDVAHANTAVDDDGTTNMLNNSHMSMPNLADIETASSSTSKLKRRPSLTLRTTSPVVIGRVRDRAESTSHIDRFAPGFKEIESRLKEFKAENFRLKVEITEMRRRRQHVPDMTEMNELQVLELIDERGRAIDELNTRIDEIESEREVERTEAEDKYHADMERQAKEIDILADNVNAMRQTAREEEQRHQAMTETHTEHLSAELTRVASLECENEVLRAEIGEARLKEVTDTRLSTVDHQNTVNTTERRELELADVQEKLTIAEAEIIAKTTKMMRLEARVAEVEGDLATALSIANEPADRTRDSLPIEEGDITNYGVEVRADEELQAELDQVKAQLAAVLAERVECAQPSAPTASPVNLANESFAAHCTQLHNVVMAHKEHIEKIVADTASGDGADGEALPVDVSHNLLLSSVKELVNHTNTLITSSPANLALRLEHMDGTNVGTPMSQGAPINRSVAWAQQLATNVVDGSPVHRQDTTDGSAPVADESRVNLRWSVANSETLNATAFEQMFANHSNGASIPDLRMSTESFMHALGDASVMSEFNTMSDEWKTRCLKLRDLCQALYGRLTSEHVFLREVMDKLRPSEIGDIDVSQLLIGFEESERECQGIMSACDEANVSVAEANASRISRLSTALQTSVARLSRLSSLNNTDGNVFEDDEKATSAPTMEIHHEELATDGHVQTEHVAEMNSLRAALEEQAQLRAVADQVAEGLRVTIATLETKLVELTEAKANDATPDSTLRIADLERQVAVVGDELEEKRVQLEAIQAMLPATQQHLSEGAASLVDALRQQFVRIDTLESEVVALLSARDAHNETVAATNGQWENAQREWQRQIDELAEQLQTSVTLETHEAERARLYAQMELVQQECEERNAKYDDLQSVCEDLERELATKTDELHALTQEHDKAVVDADIISAYFERIASIVLQTIKEFRLKKDSTFDASSMSETFTTGEKSALQRLLEVKKGAETEVGRVEWLCTNFSSLQAKLAKARHEVVRVKEELEGAHVDAGKSAELEAALVEVDNVKQALRHTEESNDRMAKNAEITRRECQLLDTKFNTQVVTIDDLQKQLAIARATVRSPAAPSSDSPSTAKLKELMNELDRNNTDLASMVASHKRTVEQLGDANEREAVLKDEIRALKHADMHRMTELELPANASAEPRVVEGARRTSSQETVGGVSTTTTEANEYDEVVKECRERARGVVRAINDTALLVKKFGDQRRDMTTPDWTRILDSMRSTLNKVNDLRAAQRQLADAYMSSARTAAALAYRWDSIDQSTENKCELHSALIAFQCSELDRLNSKVCDMERVARNDAKRSEDADVYGMVQRQHGALGHSLGSIKKWIPESVPGVRLTHVQSSSSQHAVHSSTTETDGKRADKRSLKHALSNKN